MASKGLLKNLPHKLFMTDATSDMSVRGVAIPTLQQLSVYVPPAAINGLSKSVRMCVCGEEKKTTHTLKSECQGRLMEKLHLPKQTSVMFALAIQPC